MEYFRVDFIEKMILEHPDLWRPLSKPCGYLEEEPARHGNSQCQSPDVGALGQILKKNYSSSAESGTSFVNKVLMVHNHTHCLHIYI